MERLNRSNDFIRAALRSLTEMRYGDGDRRRGAPDATWCRSATSDATDPASRDRSGNRGGDLTFLTTGRWGLDARCGP